VVSITYVFITAFYFRRWLIELGLQYYELVRGIPLFVLTPVAMLGLWIWCRRSVTNGSVTGSRQHSLLFPAVIVVGSVSLDPIYCWLNFNPSVDSRYFYPDSESIDFLRKDQRMWRLIGLGDALPPNTSSYYHLQDSLGYDGMTYKRYFDFMGIIDPGFKDLTAALELRTLASKPWNPRTRLFDEYLLGLLASKDEGFVPYLRQAYYWNTTIQKFRNRRLLDLMNVKYVMTPPFSSPDEKIQNLDLMHDKEVRIYLNKTVLPRALIVSDWTWMKSDDEVMRAMSEVDFDPAVMAILQNPGVSETGGPLFVPKAAVGDVASSARILSYENERVVLESETSSDAVLVLTDVYYPGWKCTIDEKQVDIFIANFLFRGINLPAGKHQIVFFYEPASFMWGLRFTGIAALGTLAALIYIRSKRGQT
jgi:hypothetical protein